MDDQEKNKAAAIKALAVVGFIVLLIFCLWAIVQLVSFIPNSASNIGSIFSVFDDEEKTTLTLLPSSTSVESGESFTLSWAQDNEAAAGTYAFSYDCANGLTLETPGENGSVETLSCGTTYNFVNESSVALTARSLQQRYVDAVMRVSYTPRGGNEPAAKGSAAVTVTNAELASGSQNQNGGSVITPNQTPYTGNPPPSEPPRTTTPPPAPAPTPVPTPVPQPAPVTTYVPTTPQSNPNGRSDLAVKIIAVGTYTNGVFTPRPYLYEGQSGAVQIEVRNLGDKTSGGWELHVELPTDPSFTYHSDAYPSLRPQEGMSVVVAFSDIEDEGRGEIEVELDPFESDSSHGNNETGITFDIRD